MKIFSAAAQQTNAGVQAGDNKSYAHQHCAPFAKQAPRHFTEEHRTIRKPLCTCPSQTACHSKPCVNQQKDGTGNPTRTHGALYHASFLFHATAADIQRNHNAKIQSCYGVHRLISIQKAFRCGIVLVYAMRRIDGSWKLHNTACYQNQDQPQQQRAGNAPQKSTDAVGMQRHCHCHCKKHHGIPHSHSRRCLPQKRHHRHFKRSGRRAGNSYTWPNRQINQQREGRRKPRPYTPSQHRQAACARCNSHPQHRQTNRTHGKSHQRQQHFLPCHCTQIRRKNQVSRAKEHGK